jgi:hypothetical protein
MLLEFPIHKLIASGFLRRAIRAQGISRSTSLRSAEYSCLRLSFSSYDEQRVHSKLTKLTRLSIPYLIEAVIMETLLRDVMQEVGQLLLFLVRFNEA